MRRSEAARVVAFFALTTLASALGRLTLQPHSQVVLVSPLAGLAFLWLAGGTPRRQWRWDLPALVLSQVVAVLLVPPPSGLAGQLLAAALLAWVQPVLTVLALRASAPHLWGRAGARPLRTPRDLLLVLLAGILGALPAALLRWWGLGLVPPLDPVGFGMALVRNLCWVLAIGVLGLQAAPHLARLRVAAAPRELLARCRAVSPARAAEAALVVALTAALFLLAADLPITFVLGLLTVWAAMRAPVILAEAHAVATGTTAVLLSLAGLDVFARPLPAVESAALAQGFTAVLVLTAAAVGLSAEGRRTALARAEASEATAASRASVLDTVIENLREGVVVMDADGSDVLRNLPGRTILDLPPGLSYDEALPGPAYGIFDDRGERLDVAELPHARALRGSDSPVREYLVRTPQVPDGLVLEIAATPVAGHRARPLAVVNFRDVTRERRERDSLTSFAGVVAHDLTNPLSIVDGWAEALKEEFRDGPVQPEDGLAMLARIQASTAHMREFIADLLAYTVARDQPLRPEDLDLSQVAEGVAMMRRPDATRPRITVQPGLRACADHVLVRQLLDNLIGNAVKYVAPGVRPQVAVTGSVRDGRLRVEVADNGVGVPERLRRKVFENFQRAHGADYPGTGLGLAICLRIVERHGGTIRVEDNPPGAGSVFSFTLPAVQGPASGPASRPISGPGTGSA